MFQEMTDCLPAAASVQAEAAVHFKTHDWEAVTA